MKVGKSVVELAQELERQKNEKRDFVAPVGAVSMELTEEAKPVLALGSAGNFGCTDIAHGQIAEYVGVPAKYYERMRSDAPALLVDNVNHWMKSDSKNQRLVRTLDGNVRAFLSDRYRPLDNYDLAEVALPVLLESGCRIESCEVTEKRLYIKAVTSRLSAEVKVGDTVEAGIAISNSEVGMGSLSIDPLLFRLVCANGLIVNDSRMRKTHVGRGSGSFDNVSEFLRDETREADDKAFWMKVRDVISASLSSIGFDRFVERFAEAQKEKIEGDPFKVVELTRKQYSLSDTESKGVLTNLLASGDMSRFGLVNAVTLHAQAVPSYDRSTELEKLGGLILELPKKDWSVISSAN